MSQKASALPAGIPNVQFSFRNHLLPPIIGVAACLFVYGALNFPVIKAQAEYYANQYTFESAHSVTAVPPQTNQSDIIIPGIKVKAPVVYATSTNNTDIATDLRNGVVHYGTTPEPGQNGNVVMFGHSSGVAWEPGNYKFVFTLLNKLHQGDQISVDYHGTRYVYVVTSSQIVAPSDMNAVNPSSAQPELSLITCTPVGTSKNRLIVHAKQISPDPAGNQPFVPNSSQVQTGSLPSN